MKLLVVSHPENDLKEEADHVHQLFKAGLEIFHLRKPNTTMVEFEETLTKLPPTLYKNIVIHQHYKLIEKYNLKGIHLTEWFMKSAGETELRQLIAAAHKRRLTVSGSFHSIAQLETLSLKLDYVFISPVFNSLSKQGYTSAINFTDVQAFLKKRRSFNVIALGGVDKSNVLQVKHAGFDGAALLGAIWNNQQSPHTNFQILQNCITA